MRDAGARSFYFTGMFYGVGGCERGAAKGKEPPSSRIHPSCSLPLFLYPPPTPARVRASVFSPSRGESIRKIKGKSIPVTRATCKFFPSTSSPSLPSKRSFDKAAMHADSPYERNALNKNGYNSPGARNTRVGRKGEELSRGRNKEAELMGRKMQKL